MGDIARLTTALDEIKTIHEFRGWVKFGLRQWLPHAAFLATVGKLYGLGSVPTHRIDVDFPLSMLEELKNGAGALNDPLICAWLKTGKPRFIELQSGKINQQDSHRFWCSTLRSYGIRDCTIHGMLDHKRRRFAAFQIGNMYGGGSLEATDILSELIEEMSRAVWRIFDGQLTGSVRYLVGHPTLSLTPTELHIVELLAQGLSNKEIARLRGVSDSTVKTQVQKTGAKLGATRRAEIVALAMPMLSPFPAQSLIDYGDFSE